MVCDYILPNSDIEEIYEDVVSALEVSINKMCGENPGNSKCASIAIKVDDESLVISPIKREYFLNKSLVHQEGMGKVAEHIHFFLKEDYRKNGIATRIHENEINVYRRNNFKQIQLTATGEGILAWKKLFYKYKDSFDVDNIKSSFWVYLRNIHRMDIKDIESKFKDKDLEYILNSRYSKAPSADKESFFEWFKNTPCSIGIEMYKDI